MSTAAQLQRLPEESVKDTDSVSLASSGDAPSFSRRNRVLSRASALVKPSGAPNPALQYALRSDPTRAPSPPPSPLRRRLTDDLSTTLKNILKPGKEKDQEGAPVARSKSTSFWKKPKDKKDKDKDKSLAPSKSMKKPSHGRSFSESLMRGLSGSSPARSKTSSIKSTDDLPASSFAPTLTPIPASNPQSASSTQTAKMVPVLPPSDNKQPTAPKPSIVVSTHPPPTDPAIVNATDEDDFKVPALLLQGTPLLKISNKGQKNRVFRLDPDQGQVLWPSKKAGIITIENIREMRAGADARNYREQYKIADQSEPRWLTIVYICDGQYKTLHVVAFTDDVFKMWDTTLRRLVSMRQEVMTGLGNVERRQRMWEKQYWKGADASGDEKLEFKEIEKMCRRLNIFTAPDDLAKKFKQADVNNKGYLDFTDFQRFVTLLKARPEVLRLFNKLKKDKTFDYAVFEKFMLETQKSDLDRAQLIRIFSKYARTPGPAALVASPTAITTPILPAPIAQQPAPVPAATSTATATAPQPAAHPPLVRPETPVPIPEGTISLDAFTSFLMSAENSAFSDIHGKIHHDMTRPLSDYYISSSHNTYLVGNQLVGNSTIEGYIRALLQGCRSVELDIWDGDNEPCIYHGRTLTSKVSLRDVVRAITKYAFVSSPFPIIISAEIHCNVEQQDMVAATMREEFGDMLITGPLPGREHELEKGIQELPSPDDLRGKILLKAKNLYVAEDMAIQSKGVVVDTESSSTETSTSSSDMDGPQSMARGFVNKVRSKAPKIIRGNIAPSTPNNIGPDGRPKIKMSFALVALLVYTVGVKCRGFNKKESYDVTHLFSLSERTANKILKQSMVDLIKHTRNHCVRIYPNGTRLNSTNFEPHRYWAAGAQLVALNWQTFDLGYMINFAMFQRNGRSGFVLKPAALRLKDAKESLGKRTKHFLDVTIISAQQLPRRKDEAGHEIVDKSIVDPYVQVSVHIPDWSHSPFLPDEQAVNYSPATNAHKHVAAGVAAANSVATGGVAGSTGSASSARTVSARTGVVKNNGFNPVWEEKLSIPFDLMGDMKDLVFVRFDIKEEDGEEDNPLGVYCMSLGSLLMGYRHLPLHDKQMSQYLFSTLFVKLSVRDV